MMDGTTATERRLCQVSLVRLQATRSRCGLPRTSNIVDRRKRKGVCRAETRCDCIQSLPQTIFENWYSYFQQILSSSIALHVSHTQSRSEHMSFLAQAQLLVEGFCRRLAAKEVLKRLHLVLGTTAFKNSVSVTSTFLAVHRVLLKDGVEHISRIDLG